MLMNEKGSILKIVSEQYPLLFPYPNWSEQSPDDWVNAVFRGIARLTADCDKNSIAGIGAGGQMHGLVALDKSDRVIRPAILWNDGRTKEETDYLNSVIGKDKLAGLTGNIAFAGFTAPKLMWMKNHERELFDRIDKIMLPKDYINYVLTGVHCTDYSDASGTLLLDVENKCWSREMLAICGIKESMLPRLFESYEIVGTLRASVAEKLGLPKNIRIAAGAGDNAAAAIGTGTVEEGSCNISIGTSGTVFIASEVFRKDSGNALHAFAHANGKYHLMGCMLSAGSCNKWWTEGILRSGDYALQEQEVSVDRLGKNHVYFLPYLMGERAPHNDTAAKGCFIGLSMDCTRADMTQAVMEGVAFGIRDSVDAARELGVNINKNMICGGGAKSALWKRIFANVLNIRLMSPETEQGPGFGGAVIAAVACGEYESVEDAAGKIVRIRDEVVPDAETAALYEERYQIYRKLYPALKDTFPKLQF